MTKAELIDRIARSRDLPPDISKKLIGQILGIAFDELATYFARSRVTRSQSPRFTFPHFGTFTKKRRSARRGVNPRTLEPIQIEACDTIDFKVSRELREAMNPRLEESTPVEAAVAKKPAAKKPAAKKSTTKKSTRKTKARVAVKPRRTMGPGQRRLTPRDEAELEAITAGATNKKTTGTTAPAAESSREPEVELPSSPMQRVKGRRRTRSRGTG